MRRVGRSSWGKSLKSIVEENFGLGKGSKARYLVGVKRA